jgi:LysR family hydrogen peroxide-inducible transcriptional activator
MAHGPHPFTLRQLQYVVAVADTASFRKAAALCGVSQPSLSTQLAQLEEAIGLRLFERAKQPVIATRAGRPWIERARTLVRDAGDLARAAAEARDPLTGPMRLGVIPTISPYWLPRLTPALRKRFPSLAIGWREEKTGSLVAAIDEGALDAAVLALEADLGDLERLPLVEDPFVVVVRGDHPLAKGRGPIAASELRGHELLLLDDGHCFRAQALDVCATARVRESEFRATSMTTLVQMVVGGVGITLLPSLALATELARSRLVARPLAGSHAHRTLGLVWRRRSPLGEAMRTLGAAMRESYPDAVK